jgi:L-arabonate dehydrase
MDPKKPVRRSQAWFGRQDRDGFVHRSWMKNQGIPHDLLDGKPVIGICNTWSELTPCNAHFRELGRARQARRLRGGRLSARVPGDVARRDAAAAHRDAVPQPRAMDVEESIRGNPIDGVVLLMGCDKTTPALLMGAASCDLPTIGVSGGPMLNGKFRGKDIGSGTDVWQMSEMVRAGEMTMDEFTQAESCMSRSQRAAA